MKTKQRGLIGVGVLTGLGGSWPVLASDPPYVFHGIVSQAPPLAADFTLTAHTDKRVNLSDFRGRFVLFYFGYTHCPGICPITLADLNQALQMLPPDRAEKVQVCMISVDPERDRPDRLAAYMSSFNPSFVGVTGTPEEIAVVAARYGIYFKRQEGNAADGYMVDHTSMVIVVDEEGYVRLLFPFGTRVQDVADNLAYPLRYGKQTR